MKRGWRDRLDGERKDGQNGELSPGESVENIINAESLNPTQRPPLNRRCDGKVKATVFIVCRLVEYLFVVSSKLFPHCDSKMVLVRQSNILRRF